MWFANVAIRQLEQLVEALFVCLFVLPEFKFLFVFVWNQLNVCLIILVVLQSTNIKCDCSAECEVSTSNMCSVVHQEPISAIHITVASAPGFLLTPCLEESLEPRQYLLIWIYCITGSWFTLGVSTI